MVQSPANLMVYHLKEVQQIVVLVLVRWIILVLDVVYPVTML